MTIAALLGGCGPGALGLGIGALADDGNRTETVILLLVNDGDRDVVVRLDGIDGVGAALPTVSKSIPSGSSANVEVQRSQALRLRAAQAADGLDGAPVTWDCRLDLAPDGTRVDLDLEAAVCSGLRGDAGVADQLVLDRLVGDGATASFARVGGGDLPFTPDRSVLHPGGGYFYCVRDAGGGVAELHAFRIDARSGLLQHVEAESGSAPQNPRLLDLVGAFADLDVAVDPLGRAFYVMQRLPAEQLSVLSLLPILADGSLGPPQASVRGLIGDLAMRPDGRRLYLTEDLGGGYQLREFEVDAAGGIDFAAGQAAMPCVDTEGGRFVMHPSGRFLYTALHDPASDLVKIAAYFVGDNGGVLQVNRDCGGFETVDSLQVEGGGEVLYATGTAIGGARRVLRYALDPVSGALGALAEQDLGTVSNLTATDDPGRAETDPLRCIVYVAIDDHMVPHRRQPDGSLQALSSGADLDFGSPSSVHFVRGMRRGCVLLTNPN